MKNEIINMPAGKYYIVDLRCLLSDLWGYNLSSRQRKVCSQASHACIKNGLHEIEDFPKFWSHSTFDGDGNFAVDKVYNNYILNVGKIGVDNGNIAVIYEDENFKKYNCFGFGVEVEFSNEIQIYYSKGVFYIGDIRISTGEEECKELSANIGMKLWFFIDNEDSICKIKQMMQELKLENTFFYIGFYNQDIDSWMIQKYKSNLNYLINYKRRISPWIQNFADAYGLKIYNFSNDEDLKNYIQNLANCVAQNTINKNRQKNNYIIDKISNEVVLPAGKYYVMDLGNAIKKLYIQGKKNLADSLAILLRNRQKKKGLNEIDGFPKFWTHDTDMGIGNFPLVRPYSDKNVELLGFIKSYNAEISIISEDENFSKYDCFNDGIEIEIDHDFRVYHKNYTFYIDDLIITENSFFTRNRITLQCYTNNRKNLSNLRKNLSNLPRLHVLFIWSLHCNKLDKKEFEKNIEIFDKIDLMYVNSNSVSLITGFRKNINSNIKSLAKKRNVIIKNSISIWFLKNYIKHINVNKKGHKKIFPKEYYIASKNEMKKTNF